jgi:hypothetical protein
LHTRSIRAKFTTMRMFICVALLCLCSCSQTPEQKACVAVKEYLKGNLDDPRSYEPGQFEVQPEVKEVPDHQRKKDSLLALMKSDKLSVRDWIVKDSLLNIQYLSQMTTGWNITHAFRAKNKFGALVSDQATFFVDKNYQVTPK